MFNNLKAIKVCKIHVSSLVVFVCFGALHHNNFSVILFVCFDG